MAPGWKERKGKDWDRFELNWGWKILMCRCHVCFLENWGHWRNFGFGFLFFQRFELENVPFQKNFPFNFEANIWWWSRFDNAILTSAAEKSCRPEEATFFLPTFLSCSPFLTSGCFENSWPETKIRACVLTPATTQEQEEWRRCRIVRWRFNKTILLKKTYITTHIASLRQYF